MKRTLQKRFGRKWVLALSRLQTSPCQNLVPNLVRRPTNTKATPSAMHKMIKITSGRYFLFTNDALLILRAKPALFFRRRALQDSADRLVGSFEALGPEGGYLSTQKARDVLVRTGLGKDQLREIWNLSDMDKDGLFDRDEYVVAMFLCDAVIQKGRPIPAELPASVVPPSKRHLMKKGGGF